MGQEDHKKDRIPGKRPYDNTRREAQARETRERIIESVVNACLENTIDDLCVAEIAARTGISPATIYRHFPNREVLLEAVDNRLAERLGRPPLPESVEELAANAPDVAAYYENNLELIRLHRATGDKLDTESRSLRDRFIGRLLEEETTHLSAEDARAVHSIFRFLFSFDLYLLQRDRFEATPESAGRATRWAIETLQEKLRSEREDNSKSCDDLFTTTPPQER